MESVRQRYGVRLGYVDSRGNLRRQGDRGPGNVEARSTRPSSASQTMEGWNEALADHPGRRAQRILVSWARAMQCLAGPCPPLLLGTSPGRRWRSFLRSPYAGAGDIDWILWRPVSWPGSFSLRPGQPHKGVTQACCLPRRPKRRCFALDPYRSLWRLLPGCGLHVLAVVENPLFGPRVPQIHPRIDLFHIGPRRGHIWSLSNSPAQASAGLSRFPARTDAAVETP